MEKITAFVEEHKKAITLIAAGIALYSFGYRRGYHSFEKAVIDTCKAINENCTKF